MSGRRRLTGSSIELLCDGAIIGPTPNTSIQAVNTIFAGDNSGQTRYFTTPLISIPTGGGSIVPLINPTVTSPFTPLAQLGVPAPIQDIVLSNAGLAAQLRIESPHTRIVISVTHSFSAIGVNPLTSVPAEILTPSIEFNVGPIFDGAVLPHLRPQVDRMAVGNLSPASPSADPTRRTMTYFFDIPAASNGTARRLDLNIFVRNLTNRPIDLSSLWSVTLF